MADLEELTVTMRLRPRQAQWLRDKCEAHGWRIERYFEKAVAELYSRDDWRKGLRPVEPGETARTFKRD